MRTLLILTALLAGCVAPHSDVPPAATSDGPGAIEVETDNPCRNGGCDAVMMNVTGIQLQDVPDDALVIYHPDSRPTRAMYEQNGTMHPDFYSVHDATHDWFTDWNIEAQYTYFDGSPGGFFLSAIDGRPAPGEKAYWQLLVRGEPSEVGMSDLPAAGLGNLTWALTPY